ncbi:MAG TPA: hypothetical protein VMS09_19380 [Paenibacillus sp.]|uniref:hypothetical protein n=1 Tax=Paenibacillus sp. TaxID=58172 RepID=UPI0028D18EF0|nr:hypothetical protein [Paenibacillus sp.]HUC94149.1 hypothetical protein [Paenibacillus sp.]
MSDIFPQIYEKLRHVLQAHDRTFINSVDSGQEYALVVPHDGKTLPEHFFASAVIRKQYVSFYLMPVYIYPELLDGISPELKKRMQGKSCFNFKKPDAALFSELEALTAASVEKYRQEGRIA